MRNKTISNSVFNVIRTMGTILFPVLTFSYASRIFLADGMGRINFARSVISIFSMLSMLGINYYGIRECAKRRDDREKLSEIFSELMTINFISVLFSYVLLFIFIGVSSKACNYRNEILIYSVRIFLGSLGVEWLYTAVEDYKYMAMRSLLLQAISLFAVLLLVHKKEDIYIYILINVVAICGINIVGFMHARKYVSFSIQRFCNLRKHIRPIFDLFLVTVFIQIFTDMDTVMVGLLSTETEVGLYSASYKISSLVSTLIASATTVIMPRISYVFEKGDDNKANELLRASLQFILLIGIPLSVGACIYSYNFIVILSGKGFVAASVSAKILAIRAILSPINGMLLLHYLIPRGEEKTAIIITAIAAIGNIILNALLIPNMGANGAAIATVISEIIELVCIMRFIPKFVSYRYVFSKAHQYCLAVIPVAFVALLSLLITDNDIISMVIGICISVPLYILLLTVQRNQYLYSCVCMVKSILVDYKSKHNN